MRSWDCHQNITALIHLPWADIPDIAADMPDDVTSMLCLN